MVALLELREWLGITCLAGSNCFHLCYLFLLDFILSLLFSFSLQYYFHHYYENIKIVISVHEFFLLLNFQLSSPIPVKGSEQWEWLSGVYLVRVKLRKKKCCNQHYAKENVLLTVHLCMMMQGKEDCKSETAYLYQVDSATKNKFFGLYNSLQKATWIFSFIKLLQRFRLIFQTSPWI